MNRVFSIISFLFLFITINNVQANIITTINFDNLASGTILSNQFQSDGVQFIGSNVVIDIEAGQFGTADFGGTLPNAASILIGSAVLIKFVTPTGENAVTNLVGWRAGDGDANTEFFRATGFDIDGQEIFSQDFLTTSGSTLGGRDFTFNATTNRINSIIFEMLPGTESGAVFDDFRFHDVIPVTAIPLPAPILLFISGLIGLTLVSRKK